MFSPRPRRFVFYAVNGLGLGHVTRLLSIARALRRQQKDSEILFLTSSEADNVIFREGFAAVKVPSKTIREEVGLKKPTWRRLVQTVIWNALSAFDPDVLVVDTYPAGSFEELLPVLRWRQKNAFVFREQRPEAAESELMQATLPLYDLVLVPHDDLANAGLLPEPQKAKAVGPVLIRDRSELPTREAARAALGLSPTATLVYAAFGGGGDPEAAQALSLTSEVVKSLGHTLVVGAGPLLRELPPLEGAHVVADRFPALDFLPAFDAAVSAAGYNSVHELLYAGVPSVLVPFARVLDDQEKRVQAMAAKGAAVACAPLTRESLKSALAQVLNPESAARMRKAGQKLVSKNGAEACARALLEL